MTIIVGKTEGEDALFSGTPNNPQAGARPVGWNVLEPQNVPVLAQLDTTGRPIRTVTPDGRVVGATGFPIILSTPVGFRWTTHGLRIGRALSGVDFSTDFDITSLIPTPTRTYFVNPISGNNGNAGTSEGTAFRDLTHALTRSDVDQIRIVGLTSDFVGLGVQSWNNTTNQARSIAVINRTGFRYISAACAALPTWVATAGRSNVFETTIAAASARAATDLSLKVVPTYIDRNNVRRSLTNVPAKYRTLVRVASIAAVEATPGSMFHDGTNLYVRAHDSRNLVGDQFMIPTTETNNGRFTSTANNVQLYVEGLDFVGGNRAFYAFTNSTVTGLVLAHNNCSFQGAGVGNGLAIQMAGTVYGYRSAAYDNNLDGFNYHSFASDASNDATSPNCVEIECAGAGNGTTGSSGASDNASTAHEAVNLIRINCVYVDSSDRVMADTDFAHTWHIGCHIGQALTVGTSQESVAALSNSRVWLDGCNVPAGANPRFVAAQSSIIYHCNSGEVVNNTTGEATGTVRAYLG